MEFRGLCARRAAPYPPATAVRAIFGDLHSAHRACGCPGPPRRTRFDTDQAVRALRRVQATRGHTPSVREWDALGQRPSAPAIIRHFGAWNAALRRRRAHSTRARRRWSDEEIFAAMREYEASHQRPPSAADFGAGALPGFETVRARFGSLAAVLARSGNATRLTVSSAQTRSRDPSNGRGEAAPESR